MAWMKRAALGGIRFWLLAFLMPGAVTLEFGQPVYSTGFLVFGGTFGYVAGCLGMWLDVWVCEDAVYGGGAGPARRA